MPLKLLKEGLNIFFTANYAGKASLPQKQVAAELGNLVDVKCTYCTWFYYIKYYDSPMTYIYELQFLLKKNESEHFYNIICIIL